MNKYIIDASVAVKWFYVEPFQEEAKRYFSMNYDLYAPSIIQQEMANAIVKKVRFGDVSSEDGWQSYKNIFQSSLFELIPNEKLNNRAFILAVTIGHSFYDCLYLAAAESINAVVVTADQKFYNCVNEFEHYSSLIRWVEIPPNTQDQI